MTSKQPPRLRVSGRAGEARADRRVLDVGVS